MIYPKLSERRVTGAQVFQGMHAARTNLKKIMQSQPHCLLATRYKGARDG